MPMTAMPQRIAFSHAFGALAAALVGTAEYLLGRAHLDRFTMAILGLEMLLGYLTFTGSLVAFGKLQGVLPDRPLVYRGQNVVNLAVLAAGLALVVALTITPTDDRFLIPLIAVGLAFGTMFVLRIGGADMPTVISLLNSFAGLSGAALGFVIANPILIVAGALDGSSGLLLSIFMCRAMNRSFANVLFGGFGQERVAGPVDERPVRSTTPEEVAMLLDVASLVIVVPGYGMAAAQAQHKVRELTELLERRGTEVKFAIHPVAGRMPGHMNVLLAEANVPYDQLVELEDVNPEFERCDVVLVIGANDVVNPAARHDERSPIYGMPILDVDRGEERCGDQAQHARGLRRHRERAVHPAADDDAVRRRQAGDGRAGPRDHEAAGRGRRLRGSADDVEGCSDPVGELAELIGVDHQRGGDL